MTIYWPTPGFKGRTLKLCVLIRWDFDFCVRISPLRGSCAIRLWRTLHGATARKSEVNGLRVCKGSVFCSLCKNLKWMRCTLMNDSVWCNLCQGRKWFTTRLWWTLNDATFVEALSGCWVFHTFTKDSACSNLCRGLNWVYSAYEGLWIV